jgi:DNA replication protein DnaC
MRSQENITKLDELTRMLSLTAGASRDTLLKLDEIEVLQAELHSGLEQMHKRGDVLENSQERQEILKWLSQVDYASKYLDAIHKRHAATGAWFLKSQEYQCWLCTNGMTLFCPGMPGAGKTILTSVVISDLYERYKNEQSYGISFLFNNFKEKQSLEHMLASLLQQLVERQEKLPDLVKELYMHHKEGRTQLFVDDLVKCLRLVVAYFQRVFILVDALDECNTDSMRDLLSTLFALRSECSINILATSRDIPTINSQFRDACVLEIRATDEDVQDFVRGRSDRLSNIVHNDPTLLEEAAVRIAQSVQGM